MLASASHHHFGGAEFLEFFLFLLQFLEEMMVVDDAVTAVEIAVTVGEDDAVSAARTEVTVSTEVVGSVKSPRSETDEAFRPQTSSMTLKNSHC